MIKKIDHIGIAVKSLENSRKLYEEILGLTLESIETVESQQVRVAFFKIGEVHIELLEPTSEESPIAKFISKKGEGIHHIAYASDQIVTDVSNIKEAGVKLIQEELINAAGGKKATFLHPKSCNGVLTEICGKI